MKHTSANVPETNSLQPSPALSKKSIDHLRRSKNLLAFSAGVDSSALFFLLLELHIPFDVAHVNYQSRETSYEESVHVKTLAHTYDKTAHLFTCKLSSSNFEAKAREVRYAFFTKICQEHGYDTLVTAHQLDDRFEWLMMQLCRGAGVVELIGFNEKEHRDHFTLLRPLLHVRKNELKDFLRSQNLPFFEDESNEDLRFTRNRFRHHVCAPLLKQYASGIRASLDFLEQDATALQGAFFKVTQDLYIFTCNDDLRDIRMIDQAMKRLGVVMSQAQRSAALQGGVIAGKVAVGRNETFGFIAPYRTESMPKPFKEACRRQKIPKHIRGYMYQSGIDPYWALSNS